MANPCVILLSREPAELPSRNENIRVYMTLICHSTVENFIFANDAQMK